ncbi:hypothetical protein Tco_0098767 [Tanacetum coccineum]
MSTIFREFHFTPTPPINRADKGKCIAQSSNELALNMIMLLMKQGGSALNLSILKRFRTPEEGPMTIKEIATIAEKLNIPPPHQLTDHELPPAERKRKRTNKILKEVFVIKDVVVDGMHRNLNPLQGITSGKSGQVLEKLEAGILCFNGNWELVFQHKVLDELMLLIEFRLVVATREIVEKNLDGL